MNSYLINGDCLEVMKKIPEESVDLILCDLPYGTTANTWDKIIDFDLMWAEYERIIKKQGAIVLFSSGQFTNKLINSNHKLFRYKWIWLKNRKTNFINAKNRPLASYEEICVFSKGITANCQDTTKKMNYFPQGLMPTHKVYDGTRKGEGLIGKRRSHKKHVEQKYTNYPSDVLKFKCVSKPIHPTEKPVELLNYLINTYTKENDVVLDNCMGSGSTGVACKELKRNFIGIELDKDYFDIAKERIEHE